MKSPECIYRKRRCRSTNVFIISAGHSKRRLFLTHSSLSRRQNATHHKVAALNMSVSNDQLPFMDQYVCDRYAFNAVQHLVNSQRQVQSNS